MGKTGLSGLAISPPFVYILNMGCEQRVDSQNPGLCRNTFHTKGIFTKSPRDLLLREHFKDEQVSRRKS